MVDTTIPKFDSAIVRQGGKPTRAFVQFLYALWQRTGGFTDSGESFEKLALGLIHSARSGSVDTQNTIIEEAQLTDFFPGRTSHIEQEDAIPGRDLSGLYDEIDALKTQVALLHGIVVSQQGIVEALRQDSIPAFKTTGHPMV